MLKVKYDDKGRVANIIMAVPGDMANASAEWVASEVGMLYTDVAMLAEHHNNALQAWEEECEEVAELEDYTRSVERFAVQWEEKYHIALLETAVRFDENNKPRVEWTTTDTTSPKLGMNATAVKVPEGTRRYTARDIATWLYNDGWRWQQREFYDTPVPPPSEDDLPF